MAIESAGDPDAIAKQRKDAAEPVTSETKDLRSDAKDTILNMWKKGAKQ
jgi:hypothetical protein